MLTHIFNGAAQPGGDLLDGEHVMVVSRRDDQCVQRVRLGTADLSEQAAVSSAPVAARQRFARAAVDVTAHGVPFLPVLR